MEWKYVYLCVYNGLLLKCIAQSMKNCLCIEPCNNNCTFMSLTCDEGQLIYDPDIKGYGDSDCSSGAKSCTGLSPRLLTTKNECYWKNYCDIEIAEQTIIPVSLHACTGRLASAFIHQWHCVNETDIIDICSDVTDIEAPHRLRGVIRSHPDVPWNYEKGIFNTGNECIIRLYPMLSDGATHNMVAVSVALLDIDRGSESFAINGNTALTKGDTVTTKGTTINIKFTTRNRKTRGGKGFIVCFKFMTEGEDIRGGSSVCDELMTIKKNPECIRCQYEDQKLFSKCDNERGIVTATSNLTRGSHDRCPATKTQERSCYCDYKSRVTKCSPTNNNFTAIYTLIDDPFLTEAREYCHLQKTVMDECHCVYKNRTKRRKNDKLMMITYTLDIGKTRTPDKCVSKINCRYGPCRRNLRKLKKNNTKCPQTIKCKRRKTKCCRGKNVCRARHNKRIDNKCVYDPCCRNNKQTLRKNGGSCQDTIRCTCRVKKGKKMTCKDNSRKKAT